MQRGLFFFTSPSCVVCAIARQSRQANRNSQSRQISTSSSDRSQKNCIRVPVTISCSDCRRRSPATLSRLKMHGTTFPRLSTAILPDQHELNLSPSSQQPPRPKRGETISLACRSGCSAGSMPRPVGRIVSTCTASTPIERTYRSVSARPSSFGRITMTATRTGTPRRTSVRIASPVRCHEPGRSVIPSCTAGSCE